MLKGQSETLIKVDNIVDSHFQKCDWHKRKSNIFAHLNDHQFNKENIVIGKKSLAALAASVGGIAGMFSNKIIEYFEKLFGG